MTPLVMLYGVFQKTNQRPLPKNIGLLKTAINEEWNKMSEEFILKACKSLWRCVDTTDEKMVAILSKFTVLFGLV